MNQKKKQEQQKQVLILLVLAGALVVVLFVYPGLLTSSKKPPPKKKDQPTAAKDKAGDKKDASKSKDSGKGKSGAKDKGTEDLADIGGAPEGDDALSLPPPIQIGKSWGGKALPPPGDVKVAPGTDKPDDLIFNRPVITITQSNFAPIEIRGVIFGKVQLYDNGAKKYIANTKNDTNLAVGDQFEYDKQLWQIMSISQTEVRVVSQKTGTQQVIGKK